MAIKPFETQDGIKIATGDSIVNDQGESVLNQSLNTTDSVAFSGVESPYFAFDGGIEITAGLSQETASTWMFNEDGSISFPDGTTQTTAYVGGTTAFYVAVNNDGRAFTSTDGLSWTEYTTSMSGVGRVAVGPDMIVYTAASVDVSNGNDDALWYATTSAPGTVTEVTGFEDFTLNQVKYFANIEKFVAVGNNTSNKPVILYSSNGINWTQVDLDSGFLASLNGGSGYTNNSEFTDIDTNGTGFLLTTSDITLGAFYTIDITTSMGQNAWIDLSGLGLSDAFNKIAYAASGSFTGWHILQDSAPEADAWYYNFNTDPTYGGFAEFFQNGGDLFANAPNGGATNYEPNMSEVVFGSYQGVTTIMVATTDGQILYWPVVEAGPFVSIPKPYTATITDWNSQANSSITVDGQVYAEPGEKFVVTGSSVSAYNGTFYIDGSNFVYTDTALQVPFDTSGLDPFTGTATITWSHGQYIDALHYSNGKFYAGNDDEEMFVSTNGGATWTLTDTFTGSPGEPEYMNDIDSYVTGGTITTGDITFNGVDIQGATTNNVLGSISLVPNSALKVDGQYLEIYPTTLNDAPHIHIAAGTGSTGTAGDLILGNDNYHVDVNHSGEVRIRTYDSDASINYNWQFENDGGMIFPTLTVPISDNATPSGTGQTLKFSDPTQQAIIYGPPSTVDYTSAERVIIQGAPGFAGTTGEGGDVYLWAGPGGDAGGDGGDIKIRAGRGQLTGGGGYLNFQAGQSNTGNGGWIGIESGSSNTYGNGGYITIQARSGGTITLRTYNSEGNTKEIVLDNAGTTTFPGAIVKSTVEKIGIADNVGPAATLSDAGWTDVVDGSYGPFTLEPVTFTVVISSGVAAYTVTANSGNSTQGGFIGTLNSANLGGTGTHTSNITVATVTQARTAIDLTKSVNKLTNNFSDDNYYLADGVEGQIIYLVPTPNTSNPENITVLVNHARDGGTQSLNAFLWPFGGNDGSQFFTGSICTLIYTDNHWQQVGGNWV